VDRWERLLADELTRVFDRQQAVVLARLQGTKARKHTRHWEPRSSDPELERKIDARYVADASRWVKDAAGSLAPLLRRIMVSVYGRVAGQMSFPKDVEESSLDRAVTARVDAVARGMETAVGEVQSFIAAEDEAGSSMADIVKGVRELYAERTPTWVARITTLSAVGTVNHAALSAAVNAGSVQKQWLSRRDDKVRDTHEDADEQTRPILAKFRLGGIPSHPRKSELMFPGDPSPDVPIDEVINCRCTMLFGAPSAALLAKRARDRIGANARRAAELGLLVASVAAAGEGEEGEPQAPAAAAAAARGVERAARAGSAAGEATSGGAKGAPPLERKDKVRTAAGAEKYGQPIGSVIIPDAAKPAGGLAPAFSAGGAPASARPPARGSAPRGRVERAGDDPDVRRLLAKHARAGNGVAPDPATTDVMVLRDKRGRVGAYVVWQTEDGPQPKGSIVAVSVAPALRGQRVGDQLVAAVAKADPAVQVTTRPAGPPARAARPAAPARGGSGSRRPRVQFGPDGLPVVASHARPGDDPGTSGDFDVDVKRISRLQKAYMADRMDTTSVFSRGGRWTPEREKAQQEIIDHFLNQPGVKKGQKILVLGGLPGAGKTTVLNSPEGQAVLGVDLSEYVTVNADEVKAEMIRRGMVPDYPGLSADESATMYHAESFEIAHSLMRQAAKRKLNFAYDTTLKTAGQLGFATGAGSRTQPPPWETTMLFVDVPLSVAKQRAKQRYLDGGRYLPLEYVENLRSSSRRHQSRPAENFDTVKGSVDRWVMVDNTGTDPVVVDQGGRKRRSSSRPAAKPAPAAPAPPTAVAGVTTAALPPGLPPVPAGARVYAHPQGKHIYVLPDGSMQTFKPDGKRASSSATPAKLAAGYGGWTEVDLSSGQAPAFGPTSTAPPKKAASSGAAPKLVPDPKAPVVEAASTPAPAGALPVTPMDFGEAALSDVPRYIADDDYVFQQKVDGIRGVLVIDAGKTPWFASKKGQQLQSSTAAKITGPMLGKLPATPAGSPSYRVEGELLNGKFHVFDMVVVGGEKEPYEKRKAMADAWVDAVKGALPQVEALPTARTAKEKQALWDAVVNSGAEGVMMKRRDSSYDGGARVGHTLKAKITATADVVVVEKGVGGKDNARIALLHNGKVTPIGTVSTLGKGPITVGDVVEVEYLWATADNTIAQPRILRRRPDKTVVDVTDSSQLRQVDKAVLALAAKSLRLRLEEASWPQSVA
jgi:predicted ABC-type ATPase